MNRGEVWWYELPDLGRRPGCIRTRQAAIPILNELCAAHDVAAGCDSAGS